MFREDLSILFMLSIQNANILPTFFNKNINQVVNFGNNPCLMKQNTSHFDRNLKLANSELWDYIHFNYRYKKVCL